MAGLEGVVARIRLYLPISFMLIIQLCGLGFNIFIKVVLDTGMQPLILVTYRQIFGALTLLPFALFEWRNRPAITWQILLMISGCSILGASLNQVLYALSLHYSSSTVSVALSNLLPALTFFLSVVFRLEPFTLRTRAGQAKVLGTLICFSGAVVTTLYEGGTLLTGNKSFYWRNAGNLSAKSSSRQNSFLGPLLVFGSTVCIGLWYILQRRLGNIFHAPCTSNALMCVFATIQCGFVALSMDHEAQDWVLTSKIRLIGVLYAGVISSGFNYVLAMVCLEMRGPVYTSAFSPLLLIIVGAFNWAFLDEALHAGRLIGGSLIMVGLFSVLWGKNREEAAQANQEIRSMKRGDNGVHG